VRFAALQSFVSNRLVGYTVHPLPLRSRRFRRNPRFLTDCRPPLTCVNGFILSSFTPLQRLPFRARPTPPSVELLPWGWLSLFATSASSVVTAGSHPRRLPSSAFLTPPTVCSATGLAGLFHPAATSRVLPREAPTRTAETPRRRLFALSSLAKVRYRQLPTGATFPRPALRALLRARVPVPRLRCLAAAPALPLVGPSSFRFSFPPWSERLHAPSAHGLHPRTVTVVPRTDLQRVAHVGLGLPLPRLPTCSRFPAFRVHQLSPTFASRPARTYPYGAVTRCGPAFQPVLIILSQSIGLVRVRSPLLTESR